jgi:predicted anti-sigma-YlaC factor YlaD
MFCDEALDSVEAIAAGELTPDGRIADHLGSCPNCAAALDAARRLERLLQARPVPTASPQFTARTMTKIRRARWRSDQFLDLAFNLAIGLVVLAVIGGVLILMHRTGLTAVSNDLIDLFSTGFVALAHKVGPSLPLYGAATALLAGALGIWWWAERGVAL